MSAKVNRILIIVIGIAAMIFTITLFFSSPDDIYEQEHQDIQLRAIGPEDAPITIYEFADFGCITCKAWHQFGIRDQILEAFEGKVRFVWRDFPITIPDSPKAAEAGFCAHEQNRFWDFHEIAFENAPRLSSSALKEYAVQIGLDQEQFDQCLESGKYQVDVENELNSAIEFGFRGVPSFMVNEERLIGPPSFEQLELIINDFLDQESS